jgi:hypothetical protein
MEAYGDIAGGLARSQKHETSFYPAASPSEPPCGEADFLVNSESHTGARSLVRFCMGLIKLVIFTLPRCTPAGIFTPAKRLSPAGLPEVHTNIVPKVEAAKQLFKKDESAPPRSQGQRLGLAEGTSPRWLT